MNKSNFAKVFALWLLTVLGATQQVQAERPDTTRLLPEDTAILLQVADTGQLVERFQKTAIGRIGKDPAILPIIADLYESARDGFGDVGQRIGLTLDQVLGIPQGEISIALVPVEQSRPALVVLIDAGEQIGAIRKLIERGEQTLAERGENRTTEKVGDVELVMHTTGGRRVEELAYFEDDDTLVLATNVDIARQVLLRWQRDGDKSDKSLADNDSFRTIMKHCDVTATHHPQLAFFADPLLLADAATQGNFAVRTALALAPALGLDGLKGIGASMTMDEEEFDAVTHVHLLLDNPRVGVLEMLAMKSGNTEPESWVPHDAASYTTIHWDVEKTYVTLGKLVDGFQGEGALEEAVNRRISGPLDLDFKRDVLALLDGRFTWVTWMQPPARLNSRTNLIGAKLRDSQAFRATLEKLAERFADRLEKKTSGGVTYYLGEAPNPRRRPDGENAAPPRLREPRPCIAVVDEYLLFTDSERLLERAIAARGDEKQQLRAAADYQQIAATIRRSPNGKAPGLVMFNRPEEGLRLMYDLLASEETRERLARRSEENGFIKALHDALANHPLPPFEAVQRYLAPGGGLLTSDPSGFHYIGFTLRRE